MQQPSTQQVQHSAIERVAIEGGPAVVVDYAHTPDAVEKLVRTLRPLSRGRLITVFGCGGDRDRGKRPLMAQVAESLADRIVLTSDNPRNEEPAEILRDMLSGLDRPESALAVEDRGSAIRRAVCEAGEGDIVLVAGKGHEAWQESKGQRVPFSDEAAVQAVLEEAA